MRRYVRYLIIELLILILMLKMEKIFFISIIFIVLHEFSHIVIGQKLGCRLGSFDFIFTGVRARLNDINDLSNGDRILLYFAGPGLNLVVASLAFIVGNMYKNEYIEIIMTINLGLFIFNMIPVYPLDGSKILEALLVRKYTYKKAKNIISVISIIFVGVFFIMFIINLGLGKINLNIIFIIGLIVYSVIIERKTTIYTMMEDLIKKRRKLERYNYIENKAISVFYKNTLLNILKLVDKSKFNIFYILDEEMRVLKILNEDELIDALKDYGNLSLEEYLEKKYRIKI